MNPKVLIFILSVWLGGIAANAALPYESNGNVSPFYAPKAEIVWVATNELPTHVKIYNVGPAKYSPTVESYVTRLGGTVYTNEGLIRFNKRRNYPQIKQNVPDEKRAVELGMAMLTKLEIPIQEIVSENGPPKYSYIEERMGRFENELGKNVEEQIKAIVTFQRCINGIKCEGDTVQIGFADKGEFVQLEMNWHGIKARKTIQTAAKDDITAWIKEGRARAWQISYTGERKIDVAGIKKIIVRKIELSYDARNRGYLQSIASSSQLEPYAEIHAEVEFADLKDHPTIVLFCPISKEAFSRKIQETKDFYSLP